MEDRNKTALTHTVTKTVQQWLDERGFKPVETEVSIANGWIADLAGLIIPTWTELKKLRVGLATMQKGKNLVAVVEVKTSKGDFAKDKKFTSGVFPAHFCYLAIPNGVIEPYQYPAGWGVILLSADGSKIIKHIPSPLHSEITDAQTINVAFQVAIRRDHRTRYEYLRQVSKEQRVEQYLEKVAGRYSDAIQFVMNAIDAERESKYPVHIYHSYIIKRLPKYAIEALNELRSKYNLPLLPLPIKKEKAKF